MRFVAIFILVFGGISPLSVRADSLTGEYSRYLRELSELESMLEANPDCSALPEDYRPTCNSLTDNFCATLYNSNNKGVMDVHDGKIQQGRSPTSKTRLYVLEHYKALIACLPRLPKDLQPRAEPTFRMLQEALDEEPKLQGDRTLWQRKVSDALRAFNRAVDDTLLERKNTAYPDIMKKSADDRSVEEEEKLDALEHDLKDAILRARYEEHPNWIRVKNAYAKAKQDILDELSQLKIPAAEKEAMMKRIREAKLSLPFTNPDSVGADEDCGSTTVNAYYFRRRNVLVACAGFFNAYQSESALYFVIAHELGHAIDTNSQSELDYRKKSPVAAALQKLVGSPGPAYSCEEWSELKTKGALKPQENFVNRREQHPLDKLASCLKDRSELEPLSFDRVKRSVDRSVRGVLSWYADRNLFLQMAQPTMTKYGEVEENEYYFRPDLLMQSWYGDQSKEELPRTVDALEIFTQALSCQTLERDGKKFDYHGAPTSADRTELFQRAIKETGAILKVKDMDYLSYCGHTCSDLVDENLASDTGENFADWVAVRVGKHYLARKKSMSDKREASALATSLFCTEPSLYNDAPDLALVEKKFSMQEHPDSRLRRISFYTRESAALLGCQLDPEAQGFALCEP